MSITPQTEAAFTAFLEFIKTQPPTALGPVNMLAAHSVDLTETVETPFIIATALNMKEISYGIGLYEGQIKFSVETQADDDSKIQDASATHHLRVGELRAWLDNFGAVAGIVNAPPAPDSDNRVVKDFTLSALVYESETQSLADRHLTSELEYAIAAAPRG